MGVYIKDVQKPKSCAECPLMRGSYCAITDNFYFGEADYDPTSCPIEEIDLVRCSECKYWHEGEWYNTCDKHIGHGFPSDYFCADGERRNDE